MSLNATQAKEVRWYRMNMNHVSYGASIVIADFRHKETVPANLLSVVENDDLTESLVKIAWKDKATRDSIVFVGGLVIQEYTQDDHHLARTLLATSPNWSNTREPGP